MPKNLMEQSDASRIQSCQDKKASSGLPSDQGFKSRAQSSGATNVNKGLVQPKKWERQKSEKDTATVEDRKYRIN